MKGIDLLTRIRKSGKRPKSVTINFSDYLPPKYPSELEHLQLGYAHCDDYRPFVRLDVILIADKYSQDVSSTYEALKPYASTISVMCANFESDVGWWWSKETGQQEL